ncbi:MAG: hypothetical protein WCC38_13385, partial [Pseudonocardiaceae bacterium]
QVDGMRSGQEGPRPASMPVVVRPRPVLEVLVEEVTQGGVSEEVCQRVLAADFDPEFLEPFLIELVPRANGQGLLGLGTLRNLQELGEDRVSAAFQDAYHAAFEVVHPR